MYVVTRRYQLAKESVKEVVDKTKEGFIPLVEKIPGFIDYYYVHSDGSVIVINVFETRAGAEQSVRLASEWIAKNIPHLYAGTPEIFSGDVILQHRAKERRVEAA
ncbi:MAG: antibiotic biosynthesis monooxygenase [Oligoflexia bacterium]|nr:antibiotic biosynthesis monooxygenase [Oligoflexia bacterium]